MTTEVGDLRIEETENLYRITSKRIDEEVFISFTENFGPEIFVYTDETPEVLPADDSALPENKSLKNMVFINTEYVSEKLADWAGHVLELAGEDKGQAILESGSDEEYIERAAIRVSREEETCRFSATELYDKALSLYREQDEPL